MQGARLVARSFPSDRGRKRTVQRGQRLQLHPQATHSAPPAMQVLRISAAGGALLRLGGTAFAARQALAEIAHTQRAPWLRLEFLGDAHQCRLAACECRVARQQPGEESVAPRRQPPAHVLPRPGGMLRGEVLAGLHHHMGIAHCRQSLPEPAQRRVSPASLKCAARQHGEQRAKAAYRLACTMHGIVDIRLERQRIGDGPALTVRQCAGGWADGGWRHGGFPRRRPGIVPMSAGRRLRPG